MERKPPKSTLAYALLRVDASSEGPTIAKKAELLISKLRGLGETDADLAMVRSARDVLVDGEPFLCGKWWTARKGSTLGTDAGVA